MEKTKILPRQQAIRSSFVQQNPDETILATSGWPPPCSSKLQHSRRAPHPDYDRADSQEESVRPRRMSAPSSSRKKHSRGSGAPLISSRPREMVGT